VFFALVFHLFLSFQERRREEKKESQILKNFSSPQNKFQFDNPEQRNFIYKNIQNYIHLAGDSASSSVTVPSNKNRYLIKPILLCGLIILNDLVFDFIAVITFLE